MSLIGKLFGTGDNPPDATKLDGTGKAALARSLSALPPDQPGWITFAEARSLFSTKEAEYAFGETDDDGKRNIESFVAQHRVVISFMPLEARVYFVRDPSAANVRFTPNSGHRLSVLECPLSAKSGNWSALTRCKNFKIMPLARDGRSVAIGAVRSCAGGSSWITQSTRSVTQRRSLSV